MQSTRAFREAFVPLHNRNFSIYLGGQMVSLVGTWMQLTAQSWVVWQLTHSTVDLGIVAMLGSLPLLIFGAFGGVWADRLDRRKLLVGTQVASMLLAFVFALLVQIQWMQVWHAFLLALALGCVSALDMPAQAAFVGDLSGMDQVRRAVVLNSMVMQVSRMLGPSLAGMVMGSLGVAPSFWINGASFLPVIGTLLVVHAHQERKPASDNRLGDLVEGVRFIAAQPRVQDLLLVTSFLPFFVFSAAQLFPAIVTDRLHGGPEVLGVVMGASAAGALVSSLLILPFAQRVTRVGLMLAAAVVWMGAWLAAIPFSDSTGVWVAGTFFAGLSSPVVMSTSGGLLQLLAPPDMRGRLMSAWLTFSFGIQPVGYLMIGYTGQLLGAPGAMLLNGSAMILGVAALLLLRPELRRWEPESQGAGRRAKATGEQPAVSRRRAVGEDGA